jgi:N-glycosylase/DNA lyase
MTKTTKDLIEEKLDMFFGTTFSETEHVREWLGKAFDRVAQVAKEEGRREASEEALAFGLYCSSIAIDNTEFEEVLKSFSKGKGASHAIREYERYIKSLNKDS